MLSRLHLLDRYPRTRYIIAGYARAPGVGRVLVAGRGGRFGRRGGHAAARALARAADRAPHRHLLRQRDITDLVHLRVQVSVYHVTFR